MQDFQSQQYSQSQQYGQSQQYNQYQQYNQSQTQRQRVNAIPQGVFNGKLIFACPVCQKKIAVSVSTGKHIVINCPCGRELDART